VVAGARPDSAPGPPGSAPLRANPFVLLALAWTADPRLLERAPAVLPALLAAVYLGVGWTRRAAPHLVMGFALGGLAVAVQGKRTHGRSRLDSARPDRARGRAAGPPPGGRIAALGLALLAFPQPIRHRALGRERRTPRPSPTSGRWRCTATSRARHSPHTAGERDGWIRARRAGPRGAGSCSGCCAGRRCSQVARSSCNAISGGALLSPATSL